MPILNFANPSIRRTVKPLYSTTTRTRTVPVTEEDENGDLQETGTFKTETYKERVLSSRWTTPDFIARESPGSSSCSTIAIMLHLGILV